MSVTRHDSGRHDSGRHVFGIAAVPFGLVALGWHDFTDSPSASRSADERPAVRREITGHRFPSGVGDPGPFAAGYIEKHHVEEAALLVRSEEQRLPIRG